MVESRLSLLDCAKLSQHACENGTDGNSYLRSNPDWKLKELLRITGNIYAFLYYHPVTNNIAMSFGGTENFTELIEAILNVCDNVRSSPQQGQLFAATSAAVNLAIDKKAPILDWGFFS